MYYIESLVDIYDLRKEYLSSDGMLVWMCICYRKYTAHIRDKKHGLYCEAVLSSEIKSFVFPHVLFQISPSMHPAALQSFAASVIGLQRTIERPFRIPNANACPPFLQ